MMDGSWDGRRRVQEGEHSLSHPSIHPTPLYPPTNPLFHFFPEGSSQVVSWVGKFLWIFMSEFGGGEKRREKTEGGKRGKGRREEKRKRRERTREEKRERRETLAKDSRMISCHNAPDGPPRIFPRVVKGMEVRVRYMTKGWRDENVDGDEKEGKRNTRPVAKKGSRGGWLRTARRKGERMRRTVSKVSAISSTLWCWLEVRVRGVGREVGEWSCLRVYEAEVDRKKTKVSVKFARNSNVLSREMVSKFVRLVRVPQRSARRGSTLATLSSSDWVEVGRGEESVKVEWKSAWPAMMGRDVTVWITSFILEELLYRM
jgi:hypothetical protein